MKKYICLTLGIILLAAGLVFASLPKLTLKCENSECTLYRNYFGQIFKAKYEFKYTDVKKCDVLPVKYRTDDGQIDVKTFTLRLSGDKIPYTPEWVKKDPKGLSEICWDIVKQNPIDFSEGTFLDWMKNLWALFVFAGIWIIAAILKKKD